MQRKKKPKQIMNIIFKKHIYQIVTKWKKTDMLAQDTPRLRVCKHSKSEKERTKMISLTKTRET